MSVDGHTHSAILSSCLRWYVLVGLLNQHLVCLAKASRLDVNLLRESGIAARSSDETATSLEFTVHVIFTA